jgi:hypothetical protein
MKLNRIFFKAFVICGVGALTSSSCLAAVVTWNFNPGNLDQAVGSPSHTYVQSGFNLTATGYDNDANGANGIDPLHQLMYKNEPPSGGATELGLGLVNTNADELNVNADGTPAQYIQLDLRPLLAAGFTNGQFSMASVQNGEGFRIFGSNIQGALGVQLPGTWSGLAFDNKFVTIPNFGQYQFVSLAALTGRVLAVAFQAEITPVPEMNALFPIVGLIAAVGSTQLLRRRRASE